MGVKCPHCQEALKSSVLDRLEKLGAAVERLEEWRVMMGNMACVIDSMREAMERSASNSLPDLTHYTTAQFAERVGLSEYTVREYCRHGRIGADRRRAGRGKYLAYVIPHSELERWRREGPLPPKGGVQ